jgi:hypothetical protein
MKNVKCWRPHPGPQTEAFRYFWVYELLYGGAKGGGKSDWLLFDFLNQKLHEKPEYKGIIFRRTYPRLTEIIDRSNQWFRGWAKYNTQEKCWTFPSGSKLYFSHCQHEEDKWDFQGKEYQFMGFDQIEEFTESQYEFLKIQCRTTNPDIHVRIRATANPGNIGHAWVKRKFIDKKEPFKIYIDDLGLTSMFIPAKVYDNPSITVNDPTYVKRLESLPDVLRRALLDGDWDVFAGQYFTEWQYDQHVIDVRDFKINNAFRKFIAGDYGFKNPCSIGWYEVDYDGKITRYRELYKEGLHYDTLAREILELSGSETIEYAVFDPAIWGDIQHHRTDRIEGKSGAEIMQEVFGNRIGLIKADNRRIVGWQNLRKALKDKVFQVTSNCTNLIRTLPGMIHDEKKVEDLDTTAEDHVCDEVRYALLSRPRESDKTETVLPRYSIARIELEKEEKVFR